MLDLAREVIFGTPVHFPEANIQSLAHSNVNL